MFNKNKVLIHKSSPKLGEVARSAGGVCNTTILFDTRPRPSGTPSNLEGELQRSDYQ